MRKRKGKIAEYFSKLVYSDEPTLQALGRTTYHRIPSVIKNAKPDIALVDANNIFSGLLSKEFLILPNIDFRHLCSMGCHLCAQVLNHFAAYQLVLP